MILNLIGCTSATSRSAHKRAGLEHLPAAYGIAKSKENGPPESKSNSASDVRREGITTKRQRKRGSAGRSVLGAVDTNALHSIEGRNECGPFRANSSSKSTRVEKSGSKREEKAARPPQAQNQ